PQTKAVGFDDVSVSPTNTNPGINYETEPIAVGPSVNLVVYAENERWRLNTEISVTEFLGYEDPGKGNQPFIQAPGAKPLTGTRPLARIRVRQMLANAFARPGETVAVRGAMVSRTNIHSSSTWFTRRAQTNVV